MYNIPIMCNITAPCFNCSMVNSSGGKRGSSATAVWRVMDPLASSSLLKEVIAQWNCSAKNTMACLILLFVPKLEEPSMQIGLGGSIDLVILVMPGGN